MAGLALDHHGGGNVLGAAGRVVLAEAVVENLRQVELLLRDEALVAARIREHQIHHGGDARGRGHLDGRPQASGDHLRIDLVDVVFLAQLAVLLAGDRGVDDDHVLQRLRHGVFEHALQRGAIRIELQVVHEQAHLRAMPGITHGLVVDLLALLAVGLGQRAQAARGVEGLVQRAVDLDFLETLERRGRHDLAVDHRLAGIAVLVDQSFGGPGQRILEHVVRVLGQGADAQLDGTQLVEVLGELIRRDADESRRESTLGHEGLRCTTRDAAHGAGDFDVFGEIEIVRIALARRLGHGGIAVIGQAGDDGVRLVNAEVLLERLAVRGVERHGAQVACAVRLDHRFGGARHRHRPA